jgi:hypothetical protein
MRRQIGSAGAVNVNLFPVSTVFFSAHSACVGNFFSAGSACVGNFLAHAQPA